MLCLVNSIQFISFQCSVTHLDSEAFSNSLIQPLTQSHIHSHSPSLVYSLHPQVEAQSFRQILCGFRPSAPIVSTCFCINFVFRSCFSCRAVGCTLLKPHSCKTQCTINEAVVGADGEMTPLLNQQIEAAINEGIARVQNSSASRDELRQFSYDLSTLAERQSHLEQGRALSRTASLQRTVTQSFGDLREDFPRHDVQKLLEEIRVASNEWECRQADVQGRCAAVVEILDAKIAAKIQALSREQSCLSATTVAHSETLNSIEMSLRAIESTVRARPQVTRS